MQNFKSKITLTMVSLAALSSVIAACTKEVPYKTVYKGNGADQVQEKSIIDTNAEYIYVASSDLSNQDSSGASNARPYWQGEEKIVKFRFTESSLQVYQVNEEERLQDNRTNDRIILDIPVNHLDYRCSQDRYGKCTNKEEENGEIAWSQKSKFVPKFGDMKSTSHSLLPIEMDKVFGESCFTETNSQLLGYEMTDAALNIQVQKTFKGDMKCLEDKNVQITSLDDIQSQIIYHYSFTKLKSMASQDYKVVNYPENDEGVFGFFTTNNRKYDVDFSRAASMKTQYMNRWNPDRKEIVYYLTDNFNKPEMKAIKEATYKAFEHVNNGLKSAGIPTRLVLNEPAHKIPGDVRNSMVVLVEDPVAGGPLGYGPTVANPRTGEIMSGRVAMYYGNFLQNIRYTYDEVVREIRREKSEANKTAQQKGTKPLIKGLGEKEGSQAQSHSSAHFSKELQGHAKLMKAVAEKTSKATAQKLAARYGKLKNAPVKPGNNLVTAPQITKGALTSMSAKSFAKNMLQTNKQDTARDALSAMSKYCNYPAELFPFNEIVKNSLQSKLGAELKLWNDLSTEERKAVLDILMPAVWMPTLVHEIGHNLGLRHNFGGSEDKANFYTKEELNTMGVNHEVPYSSVMDYGYSELNLLPSLGKYDIAALRFGYKREVETTEGQFVKVPTTVDALKKDFAKMEKPAELKDYSYCSDEHVEVNPNCKRFDRGTNMTEIVKYLIQSYDDYYKTRNFRNGRESFSAMTDGLYYGGTWSRFKYMRAFLERYESVKYRYNLADDAKEWEEIPFLKDLKQAVLISGEFFIRVLQTPEQVCAVAEAKDPSMIVSLGLLSQTDPNALSCFDIKLKPEYVVIGEAGKSFNNKKDPDSDNHYADQIDVRGYWPDKVAALRALLKRQLGNSSYDKYEDNYADIPALAPQVTEALAGMLFNQVETEVTFRDAEGLDVVTGKIPVEVFSSPEQMRTKLPIHWINTPLDESVAKAIGVPMQQTSFQQVLLKEVSKEMSRSQSHRSESDDFLGGFSVVKTSVAYQLDPNLKAFVRDLDSTRYVALENQFVARDAMQLGDVAIALGKLDEKQFAALIAEKVAAAQGQPPATSAFGPEYQNISINMLQAYQRGALPSIDMMSYLLSILPAQQ